MILAIGLLYIAFIVFRYVPCIPDYVSLVCDEAYFVTNYMINFGEGSIGTENKLYSFVFG